MKFPTLLDYKAYLTQNSIANSHSPFGPGKSNDLCQAQGRKYT